jgi:RHS repeat-associated protein
VNAYGKVSSLTYPDGVLVNYVPNALGEPTQLSGFASGITYHASGPAGAYTLSNGIAVSRTLNTRQLPLKLTHTGIAVEQYGYDGNANLTAIDDQLPATNDRTLGYDNLERMTSASGPWGTGTFVYDAVDNLRTTTVGSRSTVASYVGNRLTSLSTNNVASSYTYDLNGNLTAKGPQGFTFDLGNRMSTANGKATYAYDGLGRRTWVAYAGGRNKLQIYSQAGQLLYAYDTVEGVSDYVYLDGQLIAESNHLSGTAYSHTDLLGSPIARTNASGQLLSRTTFEPYGATANGTPPTDIGFTGHVHDADTALVYMQQRYYDPIAGRFLSVDPVTTDAKTGEHFNRYAYGNNSPYSFTDPDGKAPKDLGWGGSPGGSSIGYQFSGGGVGSTARAGNSGNVGAAGANSQVSSQAAKAAQLSKNVEAGKAGEAATKAKLGDRVAGEQVSFKTNDGTKTRADFVTKDGAVVETKTGGAQLSKGQEKLKADIDAGKSVTPVGQNAAKAGLKPGESTTMSCCSIDRHTSQ